MTAMAMLMMVFMAGIHPGFQDGYQHVCIGTIRFDQATASRVWKNAIGASIQISGA